MRPAVGLEVKRGIFDKSLTSETNTRKKWHETRNSIIWQVFGVKAAHIYLLKGLSKHTKLLLQIFKFYES